MSDYPKFITPDSPRVAYYEAPATFVVIPACYPEDIPAMVDACLQLCHESLHVVVIDPEGGSQSPSIEKLLDEQNDSRLHYIHP